MNVAIVHHHLRRGGVTRVIANHLLSLDACLQQRSDAEPLQIAIFHGGDTSGWPADLVSQLKRVRVSMHTVASLQYDQPRDAGAELFSELVAGCQSLGWQVAETLFHVHNHSLGKSLALPQAIQNIAGQGAPLLLQIHDFAEDFRPRNFRVLTTTGDEMAKLIYPQANHIRYAVLNRRDQRALTQAGIAADRLMMLPNPASPLGELPHRSDARKLASERFNLPSHDVTFAVYPVRGIARKNLGETLLYAALGENRFWAGITLAPQNPIEQPLYQRWSELAQRLDLPVLFDIGGTDGLSFAENLAAADQLLTTSVAEGFGMVFLEANFANRPLIGRDLPEITADFVESGMQFPDLRREVLVPISWVGEGKFRKSIIEVYQTTCSMCGAEPAAAQVLQQQCDAMLADGTLDFAQLTVDQQVAAIERVQTQAGAREELLTINNGLAEVLIGQAQSNSDLLAANRSVAQRDYSELAIGERLYQSYLELSSAPRDETAVPINDAAAILGFFLDLKRLNPVRLEA